MKVIPLLGDSAMEQFLKTAAITAELDRSRGRDTLSRRFSKRIIDLNAAFSANYRELTRSLEARRVLVAERTEAVRQLAQIYRAVRTSLKRQGALGLIPETDLARFDLQTPPLPTKMEAWITRGEKMLHALDELADEGRAPVTLPSRDMLDTVVAEAVRTTLALNRELGALKEIRDRMNERRAEVKLLHGAVSLHIRANLKGQEASSVRDVLRRYGYRFTGREASEVGEEQAVIPPTPEPLQEEPSPIDRSYPARHQLAQRNQVTRWLAQFEQRMPPLGDYNGEVLACRYMAEAARGCPPRPTFPYPLSTPEMVTAFPDLTSKLLSLPPIIVQPKDLHPFLAALHHWTTGPWTP